MCLFMRVPESSLQMTSIYFLLIFNPAFSHRRVQGALVGKMVARTMVILACLPILLSYCRILVKFKNSCELLS